MLSNFRRRILAAISIGVLAAPVALAAQASADTTPATPFYSLRVFSDGNCFLTYGTQNLPAATQNNPDHISYTMTNSHGAVVDQNNGNVWGPDATGSGTTYADAVNLTHFSPPPDTYSLSVSWQGNGQSGQWSKAVSVTPSCTEGQSGPPVPIDVAITVQGGTVNYQVTNASTTPSGNLDPLQPPADQPSTLPATFSASGNGSYTASVTPPDGLQNGWYSTRINGTEISNSAVTGTTKAGSTYFWVGTGTPTAPPHQGTLAPVVGVAASPSGTGLWLAQADGSLTTRGNAGWYGDPYTQGLNVSANPIVGIAATPDGQGYWLLGSDGGIFSYGDARFFGSTGGMKLNQKVVGIAATPDGQGYWLVARDGGIFTFGDAKFLGSMGSVRLNQPVVGMTSCVPNLGAQAYTLVASDGGIFNFGSPFFGSAGDIRLAKPITGMATAADCSGYRFVATDGGVFTYGAAPYKGSLGNTPPPNPVIALVATPNNQGYWLITSAAAVYAYNSTVLS